MNRSERRATGKKAKANSRVHGASTPDALYETGQRHKQAGRYLDAQLCCQQALAANPDHADSLHLMGQLSLEAKQYDHALEWLTRAIRQAPRADYLESLGKTLQQQGRLDEALKTFDKAAQLKPDDPELWYGLGNILADLKRPDDALLAFKHVLTLDPAHWDGAYRCGFILHEMGRSADALPYFNLGAGLQPNNAAMQEMRAFALHKLNRFEEALAANYTAHALNPNNGSTCNNIGAALQLLGRDAEALDWFDRALKLLPNYSVALLNKASSLQQFHRFDEAVAAYHRIKEFDPAHAEPDWNLSLYYLLTGDFEAGWPGREARWKRANPGVYPKFAEPRWFGEGNVEGKTILVYADEGMGDTIQFARYVPMVAARGARVILVVEAPTLPLLSNLTGVSQCLPRSAEMPAFDMHCPISTLPLVFGTRLDSIPSGLSYLPPLPETRVRAWRARLQSIGSHDRLRVGLVWSGNPIHKNDHNRSTSLRMLSRILDLDATFFSLQKDARPDDQATLRECTEIIDLTAELTDFVETAALVSCLDVVITIDSSVAHLAAALGRPTWILLPYAPDYRWLLDRKDSPWYPSVRLFRQTETRDYGNVLDRVRNELSLLIAARPRVARATEQSPDALCTTGLQHVRNGQYDDARTCGEQALAIDPDHAGALHLMGLLSLHARQFDDAVGWITRAIRQQPQPDYLVSLGITLLNQGRKDDAFKAYEKAVQLRPGDASLWKNLGDILIELQRLPEALLTFQHILTLDPRHWYAAFRAGHVLDELERSEEALAYLHQAQTLAPSQPMIAEARGVALRKLKRFDESLAALQRAHALNPHDANISSNLGYTLQFLCRDAEAIEWFDQGLTRRPDFVPALINKASSLQQLHRFDEAVAIYESLETIDPDNAVPGWNLSLVKLLTGDFAGGWAEREARWKLLSHYPKISQPIWLGNDDLDGKTILIGPDEGLGDTIQFARYVPMVANRGARVLLVVQDPLYQLLSGMPGVTECFPASTTVFPAFDVHCPIMSLPLAFGTRMDTIPAATRYLPDPPPALLQTWRDRLDRLTPGGKLRVGLVWSGNPHHGNDHNRSTSLRALYPLLDSDANFISLQKDLKPEDRAWLGERPDIIDLTADLINFVETAALVSCLDLVISIDSSVAHLAAALGRPTWILLPYVPDYRWLLDRDDSPWYPSVRLFRQSKTRDYREVVNRVQSELAGLIAAGPRPVDLRR